jgi:thioredoxin 2
MSTIELTKDNFQQAVLDSKPLIVDFWAPWCGPCKTFSPIFDKASEQHDDITFAKVNTEDEQELAGALGIRSIPTLMIFREQVLLYNQAGALSAGQLEALLNQVKNVDMEQVHAEIAAQQEQQQNPKQ